MACFDLQTALPTDNGDISNFCNKSKHFTYNCTVCDLQMEALGDVFSYLWHGVRGNRRFCWNSISCLLQCLRWQLEITFYYVNFGGQGENKFTIAAYQHVVTNFEIHSVTHKYTLSVTHTVMAAVALVLLNKILKDLYCLVQSCSVTAYRSYWNLKWERREIPS